MACPTPAAMSQLTTTLVSHTPSHVRTSPPFSISRPFLLTNNHHRHHFFFTYFNGRQSPSPVVKSSLDNNDGIIASGDGIEDDGVSLGTLKLPSNTDLNRFETLLFQWANSLCQGANLPLPVPLKVDKIPGGARLGFITIGDGKTEVLVSIDCLVFPATSDSGPIFRAIRNGPLKDQSPPGEPRIMRSLLQALQKSVEIARI